MTVCNVAPDTPLYLTAEDKHTQEYTNLVVEWCDVLSSEKTEIEESVSSTVAVADCTFEQCCWAPSSSCHEESLNKETVEWSNSSAKIAECYTIVVSSQSCWSSMSSVSPARKCVLKMFA